ncbi:MAG TPA: hypothetical protein EYP43_02890, partial [Thermoplasmata archaeon]|nr:hypothetical protein [Thermoplasmata archaeon]
MKVQYLALLLALIVVAGSVPFLPIGSHRRTRQIEPGEEGGDEELPYMDTDQDGMFDVWEKQYGLRWDDPRDRDVDTDEDGYDVDGDGTVSPEEEFTNYEEFLAGTNPADPDTDRDGMIDSWEVYQDAFWDRVLDPEAMAENLTIPLDAAKALVDGGNDTLRKVDRAARNADLDAILPNGTNATWIRERLEAIRIDPRIPDGGKDADGDGLRNLGEFLQGTDPRDPDSDDDGLPDGAEIDNGTDPLSRDTDGDTMWDGWEVDHGLNPLTDDSDGDPDEDGFDLDRNGTIDPSERFTNLLEWMAGTDPGDPDSDGDGMTDGWEHFLGLDPTDDRDALTDPDEDNLTNADEFLNAIDTDGIGWSRPNDPDTDG